MHPFLIRGYIKRIQGQEPYENNNKHITWDTQDLWYDLFGCANCLDGNSLQIEWIDNGLNYENEALPIPQSRIFNNPDSNFNPTWRYTKFTQDFCKSNKPIALVIGQDPRLKDSNTIAGYSLFADYYFKDDKELKAFSETSKKVLAYKTFKQIIDITGRRIAAEDIYVTNLCNKALPHSDSVLVPQAIAEEGISRINSILKRYPSIRYIFPMGCQVNYWLAKCGFYSAPELFLETAAPNKKRKISQGYKESKLGAFLNVCGNPYKIENKRVVIPILHAKQYPILDRFIKYEPLYENIKRFFDESETNL